MSHQPNRNYKMDQNDVKLRSSWKKKFKFYCNQADLLAPTPGFYVVESPNEKPKGSSQCRELTFPCPESSLTSTKD